MNSSVLECIEVETASSPRYAVIWLHGLGADGGDFAPMVPELQLQNSPATRFVFPHAPIQPITINRGMAMRAWYDVFPIDVARREDEHGIRRSEQHIKALIARENQRGIPTEKIVLAGFSQGCAMTLHTGLRLTEKLAGMICLSGYLPLSNKFAAERQPANQHTPLFLAHGTFDPVIELARAEASRAILLELGYDISWKTYGMQHSVCLEEIADISRFLRGILV